MLQATLLTRACSPLMLNQAIVNYKRDNPNKASNKVLVRPDGTPLLPSQHGVTLESAVFPYLFPDGTGAYQHLKDGTETLATYLKYRMQSFFTPFTLFKPYLLIMYQVRQVCVLPTV